jgi:hypothetical protein
MRCPTRIGTRGCGSLLPDVTFSPSSPSLMVLWQAGQTSVCASGENCLMGDPHLGHFNSRMTGRVLGLASVEV